MTNNVETAANPYALTSWGHKTDREFDQVLPSGQRCRMRKLEMSDIIRMNIINEVDFISGKFDAEDVNNAKNGDADAGANFMKALGGEEFSRLEATINKVALASVVQPQIQGAPRGNAKRKDDVIYVDEIDFIDRMTIFTVSFQGLGDMSDFREQSTDGVGDLAEVESPAL